MAEEEIRLNKYLSEAGICSRREADRCIEAGKVLVNGKVAGMGQKVKMSDCVEYCGREVIGKPKDVLLFYSTSLLGLSVRQKSGRNTMWSIILIIRPGFIR